jgi:DNA invertase Pin-like site-specific DNA recombinase
MSTNGKLRFAGLVRVSTPGQEKEGESLRTTQRKHLTQAAAVLGADIVLWYEGQEHATEGAMRGLFDELLKDAAAGRFDAVMVTDPSRWSRDVITSEEGLRLLRDHKVGFYLLTAPQNLYYPTARQMLRMFAGMNAYFAEIQKQKSILNRIERARRGIPCVDHRLHPFGRVWVRTGQDGSGHWELDPQKLAMIEDVAKRCLAGESMQQVARVYGVHHPHLCKILREHCGPGWSLNFKAPEFDLDVTVDLPEVPRLLDDATILACRRKLAANLRRGRAPRHSYLLGGHVYCAACGFKMTPQLNGRGRAYYRHAVHPEAKKCQARDPKGRRPLLNAAALERAVRDDLFKMLGNPKAIERAVKRAVPECGRLQKDKVRLESEAAGVDAARQRILALVEKDALTMAQAEDRLKDLKRRGDEVADKLAQVTAQLRDVPSTAEVNLYVQRLSAAWDAPIIVYDDDCSGGWLGGNDLSTWMNMSDADFRSLVEAAFADGMPGGGTAGVFIHAGRPCRFEIRGRFAWRSGEPRALPGGKRGGKPNAGCLTGTRVATPLVVEGEVA